MVVEEQKEAARILGVSPRTIRDWMREYPQDVPDTAAGYDIDAWKAFREAHGKKGSDEGETLRKVKLARAAEALKRDQIRTQRESHQLKLAEGELLPRPSYELALATVLSNHADWAEQLPDLIAGDCCKKCQQKVAERLKDELNRRREQLAEDLKRSPSESS